MVMRLFPILLFASMIFSCSEEELLDRQSDKLIGSWKFEKARFTEKWELFGDDMMHRFHGDEITFYQEGIANYLDASAQKILEGEWVMDLDDTADETLYFLDLYFYDENGDLIIEYLGEIDRLSRKKLKYRVQ
jgi:hypothetical protein